MPAKTNTTPTSTATTTTKAPKASSKPTPTILSSNLVTVPLLDTILSSQNAPSLTKRVQLLSTKLAILTNRPSQPRRGQPFEVEIQILRTRLDLAAAYLALVSSALVAAISRSTGQVNAYGHENGHASGNANANANGERGRVITTMATNTTLNAMTYHPQPNIGDLKRAENELGVVEKECKGMIKRYSRLVRLDKDNEGDRREEDRVYDSDHHHHGRGDGNGKGHHRTSSSLSTPTPTPMPMPIPTDSLKSGQVPNTNPDLTTTTTGSAGSSDDGLSRPRSPGSLDFNTIPNPEPERTRKDEGNTTTTITASPLPEDPHRSDINGESTHSESLESDEPEPDPEPTHTPQRNASTDTSASNASSTRSTHSLATSTSTSASAAKSVQRRSARLKEITEIRIEGMRMMMVVEDRLGRGDRRDRWEALADKLEAEL